MDLLKTEQIAVEVPPGIHVAAKHIVRQVIEVVETKSVGFRVVIIQPVKLAVVGRAIVAIGINKIQ